MLRLEKIREKKEKLKGQIRELEERVKALEEKMSTFSTPKISETVGNPEETLPSAAQILDEYLNGEEGEDG